VEPENGTDTDTRPRLVTVNQVVAWNIAWLRRASGLTQRELGARLGWSNVSVSEAEQSFKGKRVRKFDAQELAQIALAFSVPIAALLVPPDDGLRFADGDGQLHGMDTLLEITLPDSDEDSPVMDAYRDRFNETAARYFAEDPGWARLVTRWLGDSAARRAERAARLRERSDDLRRAASELDELAAALETEGK
jgi:transcriptional regulator with XRE-family HTH domain